MGVVQVPCSVFSTRIEVGRCVVSCAVMILLSLPSYGQLNLRTVKNYQEAIISGTVRDGEVLTPGIVEILDLTDDGKIDVLDLIQFLRTDPNAPASVSFDERRTSILEGESGEIVIEFSKELPEGMTASSIEYRIVSHEETRSAVVNVDYTAGAPVLAADRLSMAIPITTIEDEEDELTERIEIELMGGDGYVKDAPTNHYAWIDDNDGLWFGVFVDSEDQVSYFTFLMTQSGDSVSGSVVVDSGTPGLFPRSANGMEIDFTGTSVEAGVFMANIEGVQISRSRTRFRTSFERSYTLQVAPGLIRCEEVIRDVEVDSVFTENRRVSGIMIETTTPMNGLGTLQRERCGVFRLLRIVEIPDVLQELIDARTVAFGPVN